MPGSWDAIAIGAGLGGLTAAALLARRGHRVLVLERAAGLGGAAARLPALPPSGGDPARPCADLLEALGLDPWLVAPEQPEICGPHVPNGMDDTLAVLTDAQGVRGGTLQLCEHLAGIIRDAGGAVLTVREALRIFAPHGVPAGLRHTGTDGRDATDEWAPVIFGNAAPHVLAQMLPHPLEIAFAAPFRDRRLSPSVWTVTFDLDRSPATFGLMRRGLVVWPAWIESAGAPAEAAGVLALDPAETRRLPPYRAVDASTDGAEPLTGAVNGGVSEAGATASAKAEIAPTSPFRALLCGPDLWDNWTGLSAATMRDRRCRWMDRLLRDLDGHLPGLAGSVVDRAMTIAPDLGLDLNAPRGSVWGFHRPRQGPATPEGPETMLPGLFLASAYTLRGGVAGAMRGGAAAAEAAAAVLSAWHGTAQA